MDFLLEIAKHTRLNFIKLMDGLTTEQLNVIPQGFSNNIAWNFNHIVAAQQILCYVRGNVDTRIPTERVTKYQKGSRPEGFISEDEIGYYKEQAFTLLETLKADVDAGVFDKYQPVTTMFGVTLNSVNDAIAYFVTHDNLHYGYALSLRKAVLAEAEQLESQNTINNN